MTETIAYISVIILLISAFIGIFAWTGVERWASKNGKAPSNEMYVSARRKILLASIVSGVSISLIGAAASWPSDSGSLSTPQLFGGVVYVLICAVGFPVITMVAFKAKIHILQKMYKQ